MSAACASILVVDDDADTCSNLADLLTDLNYRVDTACDGVSALEKVRQTRYEAALLDLRMPGMDGLTLAREIKNKQPELVSILITAYSQGDITGDACAAGIWQVLRKPIDFPSLAALLAEALSRPTVLIVDDDSGLCASLADVLHEHSYRVSIAHSVREAREQLVEGNFRVVVIDLKLPDGDGTVVLRSVQEADPEAAVILITGFRGEFEDAVREAQAAGVHAVCYKPFDIPALLAKMRQLTNA